MVNIFGYSSGCRACNELKALLDKHNIYYTFTEVERGNHCFKEVPQSFSGSQVCGGLNEWKKRLTNKI